MLDWIFDKHLVLSRLCGGGEIRTLGTFRYSCFQDRCTKPLCDASVFCCREQAHSNRKNQIFQALKKLLREQWLFMIQMIQRTQFPLHQSILFVVVCNEPLRVFFYQQVLKEASFCRHA